MHIDDLRKMSLYWLLKTQEVRADTEHYATEITGDIYQSGWISEMYGYSFGAAEVLISLLGNIVFVVSSLDLLGRTCLFLSTLRVGIVSNL